MMTLDQNVYTRQLHKECRQRARKAETTIFGICYANHLNENNDERYIVTCSSDGFISIWDTFTNEESSHHHHAHHGSYLYDGHCSALRLKVCNGILYDVIFIPDSSRPLLITCGNEGVFMYCWNTILQQLLTTSRSTHDKPIDNYKLDPLSKLESHSTSLSNTAEFNRITYATMSGYLYGAAGDGQGYIWDLKNGGSLLGTLGRIGSNKSSSDLTSSYHTHFLHTIMAVSDSRHNNNSPSNNDHLVLTGSENGEIGIWNCQDQTLIEMIDCKSAMMKCHNGSEKVGQFTGSDKSSTFNRLNDVSVWVSSLDVDETGQYAIIGGGIEHFNEPSGLSKQYDNGFIALMDLQTRTINTCYTTRENINEVKFHPANRIISVGNNDTISSFENDVSVGRIGTSPVSLSSSFAIAMPMTKEGVMSIGGKGSFIDCFSQYGIKISTLKV
jgi:WD40 repeat protein